MRVSAADRVITISCETSGATWAGSSWVRRMLGGPIFLVWNHVERASPASGSFGSPFHFYHNQSMVVLGLVLFLPKNVRCEDLFVMLLMCALARKTVCCSSLAGFFVFTHHHEVCWLSPTTLRAKFRSQSFSSKKAFVGANYPLIHFVRLVVAGCHWPHLAALCGVWCTRPACFSWTSQQSVSDGPEFVGQEKSVNFSINAKVSWSKWFGAEAASSHRWLRRGKGLLSEAPGLGKDLCCASSRSPFGPQPRAEDQCPGKRTLPRSDVLGLQLRTGRTLQWYWWTRTLANSSSSTK